MKTYQLLLLEEDYLLGWYAYETIQFVNYSFIANPSHVGAFPMKYDITILPPEIRKKRTRWRTCKLYSKIYFRKLLQTLGLRK